MIARRRQLRAEDPNSRRSGTRRRAPRTSTSPGCAQPAPPAAASRHPLRRRHRERLRRDAGRPAPLQRPPPAAFLTEKQVVPTLITLADVGSLFDGGPCMRPGAPDGTDISVLQQGGRDHDPRPRDETPAERPPRSSVCRRQRVGLPPSTASASSAEHGSSAEHDRRDRSRACFPAPSPADSRLVESGAFSASRRS
jgi:hypothetical protein